MNMTFFTTPRIAGLLLLLSLLIILGAAGWIAVQGRLGGMAAAFAGVTPETGDASGLRTIARAALPYLMAQLAGYALLTLLLHEAGDPGLAIVALTLFVFAASFGAFEGSFHAAVTVWAAEEAARMGNAPAFFEPLRRWVNGEMQFVAMTCQMTALVFFSWAALRIGLIPSWMGWAALGWSLFSFLLYFGVLGAPLIVIVTPALLGIGLLLSG